MNTLECNECGKVCKNEKGLHVHRTKCKKQLEPICIYCQTTFTRFSTLEHHLSTCLEYKVYKIKEKCNEELSKAKEEISKEKEALDKQLTLVREAYAKEINLLKELHEKDLQLKNKDIEKHKHDAASLREFIQTSTKDNKEYREDTARKHKEEQDKLKKQIEDLSLQLAEAKQLATSERNEVKYLTHKQPSGGGSNSGNHSHNSNHSNNNYTTNNYNILTFDPTKLQNQLSDQRVLADDQQFAEFIQRCLGDYFRVTDSSRANLVWKPENGKEIKDNGGKQLVNRVIDEIKPEMIQQQERAIATSGNASLSHTVRDAANSVNAFTTNVIERENTTINKIGKKLGKIGKHIKDVQPTPSTSGQHTFNNLVSQLRQEMRTKVFGWISAAPIDFSKRLLEEWSDDMIIRGSDRDQQPRYLYVKNDNNRHAKITEEEFYGVMVEAVQPILFSPDNQDVVRHLLDSIGFLTKTEANYKLWTDGVNRSYKLFQSPSDKETFHIIFENIVLSLLDKQAQR